MAKGRNLQAIVAAATAFASSYILPNGPRVKKTSAPPPSNLGPRRDKPKQENKPWWLGEPDGSVEITAL
jgi:hypothetical protein